MDFEVYWEDNYVGKFVDGICVEQVYRNSKLDVVMTYPADKFFSRRVFPEVRWNDMLRRVYGLQDYSPFEICKRTHGFMLADKLWIKFPWDDKDLNWELVQEQIW